MFNRDKKIQTSLSMFRMNLAMKRIRVNCMDNFLSCNSNYYDTYMFCAPEQEERKVHTPYVQPQDISLEIYSSIDPITSKIQFTLNDIVMAKKAKSRKTKTIEDPNSNKKCGHWSSDENKRYHWFLELHHEHFFNKHLRRTDRIFKSMATFVQTREAQQCRSHHQKMEKKYKYFSKILMSLRLQNYTTEDSDPIISDMNEKGHDTNEIKILTAEQLKTISETPGSQQLQIETLPKTPKTKLLKSQLTTTLFGLSSTSFDEIAEEENKQQQHEIFGQFSPRHDAIDNIFDDTYERNIDFGDLF